MLCWGKKEQYKFWFARQDTEKLLIIKKFQFQDPFLLNFFFFFFHRREQ